MKYDEIRKNAKIEKHVTVGDEFLGKQKRCKQCLCTHKHEKSPILAPMLSNWYTDHAPAVWHSERSVTSWQAAKKAPQAAAASERKS